MAQDAIAQFNLADKSLGLLTGILGFYMTAAMWYEFNDALGALFGPSLGVVIGMFVFLIYQDRKNQKETTAGQYYNQNERTTLEKGEDGRYREVPSFSEESNKPITFVFILYVMIILINEVIWSDLIF